MKALFFIVFYCYAVLCYGQKNIYKPDTNEFKIMFYNVENLFDTIDDPKVVGDEEFTPNGTKRWTYHRYIDKLHKIWKTIAATGGKYFLPDVVCFSEVENAHVLTDLINKTPLKYADYAFFHRESLSYRGIDVAILYKLSSLKIIDTLAIRIDFKSDYHSRDILYLKCVSKIFGDTLHIFVNHWPSKYGGAIETERYRELAALTLKHSVDSVLLHCKNAEIVCGGDFNNGIEDGKINSYLNASSIFANFENSKLFNLTSKLCGKKFSYKYQGRGEILDQIFVSKKLVNADVDIMDFDFLLEKDTKFSGYKPKRTYLGMKYHGGFSDHLPAVITINKRH